MLSRLVGHKTADECKKIFTFEAAFFEPRILSAHNGSSADHETKYRSCHQKICSSSCSAHIDRPALFLKHQRQYVCVIQRERKKKRERHIYRNRAPHQKCHSEIFQTSQIIRATKLCITHTHQFQFYIIVLEFSSV